jgi:hypothetical protein
MIQSKLAMPRLSHRRISVAFFVVAGSPYRVIAFQSFTPQSCSRRSPLTPTPATNEKAAPVGVSPLVFAENRSPSEAILPGLFVYRRKTWYAEW